MLGAVLVFGVLAGVDNLQVCSSIGLLPLDRRRRYLLAAAFSVCETAAPLVGLWLGHLLLGSLGGAAGKVGPLLMLVCGGAVLVGALVGPQGAKAVSCNRTLPNLIFGLPLSLSFDNLLGGAGISALGYPMVPAALLIGLVSAAMSCAGLYLGGWLRRFVQRGFVAWCLEPAVGAYLCLLAVRLLVANRS
ncbi:MAG TPA: manganese efflux pump [Bryobacteraceae bacterium]|jgi:putative Mn2+ efflux pump MntP|nr:manganese efflux pump [Bryobacteraceae bacterium]